MILLIVYDKAQQLIADGYTKTDWGVTLVANKEHYADLNLLKGVEAGNVPPRYYADPGGSSYSVKRHNYKRIWFSPRIRDCIEWFLL